MVDEVGKPKDDGAISLPSIGPGMIKKRPAISKQPEPKRLGANDNSSNDKKDEKLLDELRKRFDRAIQAQAENRDRWKAALQFAAGKQWSDADATQRNIDQRPCLTVDRLSPLVRQVTNDQRMNRPAISISPVGDKGDPEAAKMYRGLIRAIERECAADIAYDTAFESAVRIGVGYFRLNTEWESEESFHQTLVVQRIRNAFTVYPDPDSKQPDGADYNWCFVSEMIPTEEFKETYPKASLVNFEQTGTGDKFKVWFTKDGVRIAEYWKVCKEKRTLVLLSNGHTGWEDELHESVQADIKAERLEVIDKRDSYERSIKWYKTNGVEILDRGEWLGNWIPIIPVYGNEMDVEGKLRLSGIIEPAMDAQRMYNYWITKYAESVALAPTSPYIMAEGQDEGYEDDWRVANTRPQAYLRYRPTSFGGSNLPPPQRIAPPGIPEGFQNGAQQASVDIMATTGIHIDVGQDRRNVDERSGKAIREFNRPQDLGAAHYMDNYQRSLRHAGNQFVDAIPKYYDEKRVMVILREDDTEQKVEIDPHASKAVGEKQTPQGKQMTVWNPNEGKYGVTVTIGPNFATKRQEARESMIEFMQALGPTMGPMIADLFAKNSDWEESDVIAQRLATVLATAHPGIMQPTRKDMTPQTQAYVQGLEGKLQQLQQQLQMAAKELQEKTADRAIAQDKVDKDYEAKLLNILQKGAAEAAKIAAETARTHLEATKASHGMHMSERAQDLAENPPKETKAK